MNTFTLGDKVVLKTSPYLPVLTVLKINENGTYNCHFESEKHKDNYCDYQEGLLQKYSDPATIIIF